jgi:hypothetical protein
MLKNNIEILDMLFAAHGNDAVGVLKQLSFGIDASAGDYDDRTALHLACVEVIRLALLFSPSSPPASIISHICIGERRAMSKL